MKEKTIRKYISIALILFLALLFVARFAGPALLRAYVETGMGNCQKIPILCMAPAEKITEANINKEYILELLPQNFPRISIRIPDGFSVVKEGIKKTFPQPKHKGKRRVNYKRDAHQYKPEVIYLLQQEPNFFIGLFPQVLKQGIQNDYEFIRSTMYAKLSEIKSLNDAFFVIMKGVFVPDLGDQLNVQMAEFVFADKRGFVNYNLAQPDNYFDCNIITNEGDFFKIYIKGQGARLDLEKVLTIISTIKKR